MIPIDLNSIILKILRNFNFSSKHNLRIRYYYAQMGMTISDSQMKQPPSKGFLTFKGLPRIILPLAI